MQRLLKFVGNLSTTEGKLKLAILVVGVLLVVVALGAGSITATSSPQFCASCHEMTPEYVTWQVSTHAEVACISCHVEPGLLPLLKDKTKALVQVYEHITNTVPNPIVLPHPLSDKICEQCHEVGEIKPQGELIIPHEKHLAAEVECATCHSGVAHGKIAQRQVTLEISPQEWTADVARENMQDNFTQPPMDLCLGCHTERKVSTECTTCHTDLKPPSNHTQDQWSSTHGSTLRQAGQVQECSQCHTAGSAITLPSNDVAAEYARSTELCSQCHQRKPAGHQADWMLTHKKAVGEKGRENCLTCHNLNQQDPPAPARTTCNTCHGVFNY